jgi:cytochrome c biogenesis protein CcmG/thiol:disulfide interchange protein DsbE
VVEGFGGKAGFVAENYGESKLAKRFGVKRYPALFVDDVLVATPNDFGFYGKGEAGETRSGGRYAPIRSAAGQERFRADLKRMIGLILAGRKDAARAQAAPAKEGEVAGFPTIRLTDLDGKTLTGKDLAGRVVLVEFWATWCPPCRGALSWLGELKKRHGDRLAVVTIAVESEEAGIRQRAAELKLPFAWVKGTPEIGRAFGDVSAVPTLLMFDRQGRAAGTYFGAPPNLHQEAETRLASLLK